jgi:uncharacterized protein
MATAALLPIYARHWQPALGSPGEVVAGVDDINQCIKVLLTTPRGSEPLRPRFGCDAWKFLDMPVTEVKPYLVRAIAESLGEFEPRARLVQVRLNGQDAAAGRLGITVVWKDGTDVRETNLSAGDFRVAA